MSKLLIDVATAIQVIDGQIEQGKTLLNEPDLTNEDVDFYRDTNHSVLNKIFSGSSEVVDLPRHILFRSSTLSDRRSAIRGGVIYMQSMRNFLPKESGDAVNRPPPKDEQPARAKRQASQADTVIKSNLYKNICDLFNIEEIKDLCFKLGIDYENLAGDTKESKTRELILYCTRHDRIADLWRKCRQLRPNASW